MPAPFDPSARIEWSPVWSLRDKRFRYLPTGFLYFFYRGPGQINADSNGCAAGNTLAEAIVQGFLELVERDTYAIWWYNRLQRPEVDLDQFDDPYVRDLRDPVCRHTGASFGCSTSPATSGFRAFVAMAHWIDRTGRKMSSSDPARISIARIALLRALTELNQFLSMGLMGGGDATNRPSTAPHRFVCRTIPI